MIGTHKLGRKLGGRSRKLPNLGKIEFPVYVFGYGSLLYPDGWNCRGMTKFYKERDLIPCWLNGYKRGMYGRFEDYLFYGIVTENESRCNGVLTLVKSEHDYVRLMQSERAAEVIKTYFPYDNFPLNYNITVVTDKIEIGRKIKEIPIHAVASKVEDPKRLQARPVWDYYAQVWIQVVTHRSKSFVKDFLATGGVNRNILRELFYSYQKAGDGVPVDVDEERSKIE